MAMNDANADLVNPANPQDQLRPFADPAYKKLSRINGDVNKMTKDQIKEKLANLRLDTRYCVHRCSLLTQALENRHNN